MASFSKRVASDGRTHYRVRVRLKGQPVQTATFKRLTDARKWAKSIEVAMLEGRRFKTTQSQKHTVAEAIDRYLAMVMPTKPGSQKVQIPQLKWWKGQLGDTALVDVTAAQVAEKRDKLLTSNNRHGRPFAPATVCRYLAIFSHVFTVASKEWEWVNDNPVKRVTRPKEPRGRVRFLSEKERPRFLQACRESRSPDLYPAVLIGLCTGMRKSEILSLKWQQVDFDRHRLVLFETKNGEIRPVPLPAPALKVLLDRQLDQGRREGLVFPSPFNPSKPVDIREAVVNAVERAGLKDFKFHDLRHSAASYLAMSGASMAEIAEILGHKTMAMVKRYAHLSESHTLKVVDRMSAQFLE